jgi:hypothetical protein
VFTDLLAGVRSRKFDLVVVPEQMQFAPKVPPDAEADLVSAVVGRFVERLPHTPYRAAGLNFVWQLIPEDKDAVGVARRLFYCPDRPLHQLFSSEDARYGGYMSKNLFGCRLRLDVKPISLEAEEVKDRLQFVFNYHLNVPSERPVEAIKQLLQRWQEAKAEAQKIAFIAIQ